MNRFFSLLLFLLTAHLVSASSPLPSSDLTPPILQSALAMAPKEHHEALTFLVKYMPDKDRNSLTPEYLCSHVALAFQARNEFPWAKSIPLDRFYNDVLPYASIDEPRENWRLPLLNLFRPEAAAATSVRDAIFQINAAIAKKTGVAYNLKRRAPNQGPLESLQLKMASCSGLSILLIDALRAVGIPARLTGVALWTTTMGNHNWVEVWLPDDQQWHFIEFGSPAHELDKGWLLTPAARAIQGSKIHGIYSTSWKPSPTHAHFPLIWDLDDSSISAVEVTPRYLSLGKPFLPKIGECELLVQVLARPNDTKLGREALPVMILQGDQTIASGLSPAATDDINRYFTVKVKQGEIYQILAIKNGKPIIQDRIKIGDQETSRKINLNLRS